MQSFFKRNQVDRHPGDLAHKRQWIFMEYSNLILIQVKYFCESAFILL
ncbi:hypothetical protein Pan161_02900 [Gimesia algae]|uniref:Uncharacterized protein n=1 Tax=Gimesia algae TaxID=2527971 RepID=A0A517V6N6_9PLAN|nr:hypothetical protein Pan161_02900 [Gimesia algae]